MKKKIFRLTMCLWMLSVVCLITGCGEEVVLQLVYSGDAPERIEDVECVSADRYAHNTLDQTKQQVYDEMLYAIMNHKERVRLSTRDVTDVEDCYDAICADYGEIFWVEKCSYGTVMLYEQPYAVSFSAEYAYTPEETEQLKAQMQPVIDDYLEQLAECESDYEKTELLYRRLISEVDYDLKADNNQNILSVFLGKSTVCQGYASAAQYLLQQSGIQNAIVTGVAQGEPHAWNLVKLDGEYYYLDVTWGNTGYNAAHSRGEKAGAGVNYSYLNLTTDELFTSHEPNVSFPVAECTATENNYHRKNHLYFNEWNEAAIGEKLRNAYDKGVSDISLKFASEELMRQAQECFITEGHISDYCAGIDQIYYVPDTDLNILSFYY